MKNIIEIEDLNFNYKEKQVFKNLKLNIKENTFTTILGLNGSGKTTLIKLILGLEKGNSVIICDTVPVTKENLKVLRKEIGVVFESSENFVAETVMDEIAFTLENLNLDKEIIRKKINSIASKLKIKNILESNPHTLNDEEKWIVSLASALVIDPKLLIIDGGFNKLSPTKTHLVLDLLNKLKEKGLTIISTTYDIEETLYGDEIIILNKGKAIISGSKEGVLENIEELENTGIEPPFIVSLSYKLNFYSLTKQIYFDEEKLVNELWK